ncbi:anthranilate phosphoribosyltransferase [Gulosibacter chungangensis]|uniref:Anthranilate phosphoribosyltransferase n=1 Tax=Gulosibacter chungangensis TaxID=979746 RepID=A0A7J5BD92_9MICO|nr:anthranilate phosphoribosyltransferase [Gulosibacter chungangensis]KAB1644012.1 anthranilate phosphoribosyltransferase [Gulosibacter chungangensis]
MTDLQTWPQMLESLLDGLNLSVRQATWAMEQVMQGKVSEAKLAAWLIALRAKGETVEELVGFRDAVLAHALPIDITPWGLDIVGTGGDMIGTVNVSTMSSFVIAAAGVPVIKHGGRAASAKSGASDVLTALGAHHSSAPAALKQVFEETGMTFLYASLFHPGFAHAGVVRKELGVSTVFNYLGPLTNPARAEASAVGVAKHEAIPLITGVFRTRGAAALVFRGDDGLDELTVTGYSHIWEVARGDIAEHDIHPRDLGLGTYDLEELLGGTPEENAEIARETLAGRGRNAVRDIVLLNSAAGMVAFDLAKDPDSVERPIRDRLVEKISVARETIESGAALKQIDCFVATTNRLKSAE